MNGGSPMTPRNARTGEFTPPGNSVFARASSRRDRSVFRDDMAARFSAAARDGKEQREAVLPTVLYGPAYCAEARRCAYPRSQTAAVLRGFTGLPRCRRRSARSSENCTASGESWWGSAAVYALTAASSLPISARQFPFSNSASAPFCVPWYLRSTASYAAIASACRPERCEVEAERSVAAAARGALCQRRWCSEGAVRASWYWP